MTLQLDCWTEIDLAKIRGNVATLLQHLNGPALMAVVKANAYGHGSREVAAAALSAGATWLGVARVEEGRLLRESGIDAPILLLAEPPASRFGEVVELGLTAALYTDRGAEELSKSAASMNQEAKVHVKIDTGMHRYGLSPKRAKEFLDLLDALPAIQATGIWTHFAVAEDVVNPFTKQQFEKFIEVMEGLGPRTQGMIRHAGNSAAAIAFPESHLDMVRVGIAMYGIHPSPVLRDAIHLEPAMSIKARVGQVKPAATGETLSYGRNYAMTTDGMVATVTAGYADGLRRALTNSGEVLIRGRRYRISGTVTMDHIMVDVGDDEVLTDDEVVLVGAQGDEEITAQEVADRLDTIPYEVVCDVGGRVQRVYLNA